MHRKIIIIGGGILLLLLACILLTCRKNINVVNGEYSYSDNTGIYNQGNLLNGSEQVYDGAGNIIVEVLNYGQIYNVAFNNLTKKFDIACKKPGCMHTGSDCISRIGMLCKQNIGGDIYYIPESNETNIWKYSNGQTDMVYKNNERILLFRMTAEYIFIETDTGMYRISNDKSKVKEQISERHSRYGDIFITDDTIYFVQEDGMLYSMKTDGTGLKKILDEKTAYPQVYNNRIYLRSMEYDPEGRWEMCNDLISVDLNGENRKNTGIKCLQYVISDGVIYYSTLPDDTYNGSIRKYDINSGKETELVKDAAAGMLQIIDESDYVLFKRDRQVKDDVISTFYYVTKDGRNETKLDYPELIKD